MGRIGRPGLSSEQKLDLWARWRAGESLSEIAIVLGRHAGSIHSVVARQGGYVPAPRCRSSRALGFAERESISRGLAAGASLRAIARELGRAPSTISRELARHGDRTTYRATVADERARDAALRPRPCTLAKVPRLCRVVADKLRLHWSPEQIAGWLRRRYLGQPRMQISHETIYKRLFV